MSFNILTVFLLQVCTYFWYKHEDIHIIPLLVRKTNILIIVIFVTPTPNTQTHSRLTYIQYFVVVVVLYFFQKGNLNNFLKNHI